MLSVQINEAEVLKIAAEKITEALRQADTELVYWDRKELMRRTCMSWGFIQEQFFFHPNFPKFKIGSKWYFPARETRDFLENWLREHGR